jgi:hypothetical protein
LKGDFDSCKNESKIANSMYRNFYKPLEAKEFLEAGNSASHMEWWNIGMLFLKGNISLINSLVNRDITVKPLSQFPETIIPSFHYSKNPNGVKPLSP